MLVSPAALRARVRYRRVAVGERYCVARVLSVAAAVAGSPCYALVRHVSCDRGCRSFLSRCDLRERRSVAALSSGMTASGTCGLSGCVVWESLAHGVVREL
jgi:hypothetical protein